METFFVSLLFLLFYSSRFCFQTERKYVILLPNSSEFHSNTYLSSSFSFCHENLSLSLYVTGFHLWNEKKIKIFPSQSHINYGSVVVQILSIFFFIKCNLRQFSLFVILHSVRVCLYEIVVQSFKFICHKEKEYGSRAPCTMYTHTHALRSVWLLCK